MKKIISVLILFSILSTAVSAQNASDFETDGQGTIISYHGGNTVIIIPSQIDGVRITAIGDRAFAAHQLTSVTIPNSVTSVGDYAFIWNQLTSVTIPNSVTSIGEGAFYGNQLTSVTIPSNVTSIGVSAFNWNPITSVTFERSGVSLVSGDFPSFPGNLATVYASGGAGTYTRPDADSTTWTKQ